MGSSILLDTVGDRLFTPVVYQNLSGTESLWATHDNLLNFPNGPVAVRWYQFDVTSGNFPATAVQQQDWTNGNDGLWRWMPSIAVDQNGNTAIGYSTSDTTIFPCIRFWAIYRSDRVGVYHDCSGDRPQSNKTRERRRCSGTFENLQAGRDSGDGARQYLARYRKG